MEEVLKVIENIPDEDFDNAPVVNKIAGNIYAGQIIYNDDELINNNIKYTIIFSQKEYISPNPHHIIAIPDTPTGNLSAHFDTIYTLITNHCEKNENILVSSDNGVSRCAAAIIYYLMRRYYETGGQKKQEDFVMFFKFYILRRPCDIEPLFIKALSDAWNSF